MFCVMNAEALNSAFCKPSQVTLILTTKYCVLRFFARTNAITMKRKQDPTNTHFDDLNWKTFAVDSVGEITMALHTTSYANVVIDFQGDMLHQII
jgi:hypothetical protein